MKLKELLKGIEVLNSYEDKEVLDVTADSRLVKEGSLFICIKGAAFDGHSVAKEMLDNGAVAVVCEHDLGFDNQIIVENSRAVYSPICANFFGNPAKRLKLIGLTGTNGKTTTSFLIKQILENVGKKVGLIGTVQNMVGDEIYPAKYTTPDPYELQKLFSLMVDAGCEYCVMEVSSQALAQGRVNGLRFALGAFTNLTQDHLDYHKTWENYFKAKRILFENSDIAVTNADDEHGLKIIDGLDFDKVVTYAVNTNDATFTAKNDDLTKYTNDANKNIFNNVDVALKFADGSFYKEAGKLDFMDNQIDKDLGTLTMRATFANKNHQLIPNDFVRVILTSKFPTTVTVVPQEAVLESVNGKYVWMIDENGCAKQQDIEVNGSFERNWIVKSGLKAGDTIISSNIQSMRQGLKVQVIELTEQEKQEKIEARDEAEHSNMTTKPNQKNKKVDKE